MSIGAEVPLLNFKINWTHGVENTGEMIKWDYVSVRGSKELRGKNYGEWNSASWTLIENKMMKKGVPAYVRSAILLKREHQMPFRAVIQINANSGHIAKIERLFGLAGKDPKDDPILFHPNLKPTNRLRTYDPNRLGDLDLNDLTDVHFATVLRE